MLIFVTPQFGFRLSSVASSFYSLYNDVCLVEVRNQPHRQECGTSISGERQRVWREQEEVLLVLVGMEEGGCVSMGNNNWWTKWLRV